MSLTLNIRWSLNGETIGYTKFKSHIDDPYCPWSAILDAADIEHMSEFVDLRLNDRSRLQVDIKLEKGQDEYPGIDR